MDIQREKNEMDAADAHAEAAEEREMQAQGMEKCRVCGCWCEDLTSGICESCIDEIIDYATVDEVADYASTLDEKNEMLLYTEYLFTTDGAIEILKEAANKAEVAVISRRRIKEEIKKYIENDIEDYIEYLEKKGAL